MNGEFHIGISVCLCTYKRPQKLAACLASLLDQTTAQPFEVIVTDNDGERSGEPVVEQAQTAFHDKGIPLSYFVEPVQNISCARNRCVRAAQGTLIAILDDDERASPRWLQTLHETLVTRNVDGVLGPVLSAIPESFPAWMRRSSLFDRGYLEDGAPVPPPGLRTGNLLIKHELLGLREGPFDPELGRIGGGDVDLLGWLQQQGYRFVWSAEAGVVETLDERRRYVRWHLRRAYRVGWNVSERNVACYGVWMALVMLVRILPSTLRAWWQAIGNLDNWRYAALLVLRNMISNLGKIGYFAGIRVEEYGQDAGEAHESTSETIDRGDEDRNLRLRSG
jgi:succinoglycan biosynthesis protein ExoM